MECIDALILDIDGVVWLEGTIIYENIKVINKAYDLGIPIIFLTNNATRSRKVYSILLSKVLKRRIATNMIVNSAYSASEWLRRYRGPSNTVIIGEEGLVEELHLAGHTILNHSEWKYADTVVVGLDRNITYQKLSAVHKALTVNKAFFLITNRDPAYPVTSGTIPGAGAIVSFLETSTGRRADYNAGKPEKWILNLGLELAGRPTNPLLVGDRVEIDIKMAVDAGINALLVLTGVTKKPPSKTGRYTVAENLEKALERKTIRFCKN